jgi:LysM repeat protein
MNLGIQSRKFRFAALLAVLMLLMAFAPSGRASAQAACSPSHIVVPGENLFRIALANGTTWPILAQLNNLPNPNYIKLGQVICLPGSVVVIPPAPTPLPPTTPVPPPASIGLVLPPPGTFPSIDFNTRSAGPGDTITITGINFPTNETVDIFIAPVGAPYPAAASGSAVTAPDGTLNTIFTVPGDVAGVPVHGSPLSVMVRGRTTGYFGFNFFFNPRP